MKKIERTVRHVCVVLGDQLDHNSSIFDGFDSSRDVLWMAEVSEEATHVWCHKLRLAFFFSAMRHFASGLDLKGYRVLYTELPRDPSEDRGRSFSEILKADLKKTGAQKIVVVTPGDHRVRTQLQALATELRVPLEIRGDRHFFDTPDGFRQWAGGRKKLLLENYYREMRRRHRVLVTQSGKPVGGGWNYDAENRETFGSLGPSAPIPRHRRFTADKITREVVELVNARFAEHPGMLDSFDLPVTRADALDWLAEFVEERLPDFGKYQDALWEGERFLYHSRLSLLLNTKLLDPREVLGAAIDAYETDRAPLNSVEGFVRQILGWREFVRGIYWQEMPEYLDLNYFDARLEMPPFFWDGNTDMACVADAMRNVVHHGYAHHIQRLMVLGLFAQLYGVNPRAFHEWHMGMYLDAIDWASAPNTIGMSQFGDGGIVGTKPYCASGNYINRMSNHCSSCRFNPRKSIGDDACPFTTLYWDFLDRNRDLLSRNRRMIFQMKNLERKSSRDLRNIRRQAEATMGAFGTE